MAVFCMSLRGLKHATRNIKVCEFEKNDNLNFEHFSTVEKIQLFFTTSSINLFETYLYFFLTAFLEAFMYLSFSKT